MSEASIQNKGKSIQYSVLGMQTAESDMGPAISHCCIPGFRIRATLAIFHSLLYYTKKNYLLRWTKINDKLWKWCSIVTQQSVSVSYRWYYVIRVLTKIKYLVLKVNVTVTDLGALYHHPCTFLIAKDCISTTTEDTWELISSEAQFKH